MRLRPGFELSVGRTHAAWVIWFGCVLALCWDAALAMLIGVRVQDHNFTSERYLYIGNA